MTNTTIAEYNGCSLNNNNAIITLVIKPENIKLKIKQIFEKRSIE